MLKAAPTPSCGKNLLNPKSVLLSGVLAEGIDRYKALFQFSFRSSLDTAIIPYFLVVLFTRAKDRAEGMTNLSDLVLSTDVSGINE